jgi:hypothetical protein
MSSGFVVYEGLGFFCEGTFMFLLFECFPDVRVVFCSVTCR